MVWTSARRRLYKACKPFPSPKTEKIVIGISSKMLSNFWYVVWTGKISKCGCGRQRLEYVRLWLARREDYALCIT